LDKLADLFFEGHLAEQAIHAGLNVCVGKLGVRWMCDLDWMLRRSRSRCLRSRTGFAPSRHATEDGAGKNPAEADTLPSAGVELDDGRVSLASCRIDSQHGFSPK
jgi:hypothetical protein